ncbi:MAG: T9SS type A sorting domain-containing protein [Ignavibacteria bacterium]|nr:T9SS type A sorting domain-containing protein [Ignavibacteria bacterium]
MRKLILFLLLIFFGVEENIYAQYTAFDSVYTVASSNQYDYTNPVFEFRKDPLNASTFLVYERHKNGGGSDIIARTVTYTGYSAEYVISNSTTDENINPVVLDSIVYWQSNKNGNWDLYYSWFNGSSWAAPVYFPGNTSQDDGQPNLVKTFMSNNSLKYLLLVKKGPDIFLHRLGLHGNPSDTNGVNLTDTISYPCGYGVIADVNPYFIGFFKEVNGEASKFNLRKFNLSTSGGISWMGYYEMDTLIAPSKIRLSYSFDLYSYFMFNRGQNVSAVYATSTSSSNMTPNIIGSNALGKGITMSYIFNSTPALSPRFSSFGCLTKRGDSNFVSLSNNYNPAASNNVKQKFLGTGSVASQVDLSIPLAFSNLYKMRAVWEKTINGKIALVESYAVNGFTGINTFIDKSEYILTQNYPNPFNPSTVIRYQLSVAGFTTLKVFDLLGKEVVSLVNEKQSAGSYAVDFNSAEYNLPSGIYFYTLSAGEFKETRKMILIK